MSGDALTRFSKLSKSASSLNSRIDKLSGEERDTLSPLPGVNDTASAAPSPIPPQTTTEYASSQHSKKSETRRSVRAGSSRGPTTTYPPNHASPPNPTPTTSPMKKMAPSKFVLYENKRKFFIVSSDSTDTLHRLLQVDRTSQSDLRVVEDDVIYTTRQMDDLLKMLEEGNRGTGGGLTKSQPFFGIAGKLS